jgi:predicted membrane channel-forming protein YqfA (hemolysin III family)
MKAEKQIKIARGTAFALSIVLLLAPGLFVADKLNKGESVTWQSALLFMGFMYVLISPLVSICWMYAWSLKRRKRKTALVFFVLLVILNLLSLIHSLTNPPPETPIMADILELTIPLVAVVLLLQGILGLRKSQSVAY